MRNKLKTRKSLLKRIKISGRKKILKRSTHQDHFNAKDSGKKTRGKRKEKHLSEANSKKVKRILPNL